MIVIVKPDGVSVRERTPEESNPVLVDSRGEDIEDSLYENDRVVVLRENPLVPEIDIVLFVCAR